MTLPATDLETHVAPPVEEGEPESTKIVGRSPMQLAIRRFRKDKLSMAAFIVVVFYFLAALAAPFLVKFGVLDYTGFNQHLLNEFTLPKGKFGGISLGPPARRRAGHGHATCWPGSGTASRSRSCWRSSATAIAVGLGTVFGIIAGVSGGFTDSAIGRLIDLILSFPQTLMLLALSALFIDILVHDLHVPDR